MKFSAKTKEDVSSFGLSNEIEIDFGGTGTPDLFVEWIGKKDLETNELHSYFKDDEKLEKLNNVLANYDDIFQRNITLYNRETNDSNYVVQYGIPYYNYESTKYTETYIEDIIDESTMPMDGYYVAKYELLLAAPDGFNTYTRRIVLENRTTNICMMSFMSDIESEFDRIFHFDDYEDNMFNGIINKSDDYYIKMFDAYGYAADIPIESVSEFMSMIISIRQIDCIFHEEEEDAVL